MKRQNRQPGGNLLSESVVSKRLESMPIQRAPDGSIVVFGDGFVRVITSEELAKIGIRIDKIAAPVPGYPQGPKVRLPIPPRPYCEK